LVDELAATLGKKKLVRPLAATGLTAQEMLRNYRRIATLVAARRLEQRVSRDVDDDAVLACARTARADLVVSGDDDLLVLGAFDGIPIVTAAQAIKAIGQP
jgi:putative PIN family toxin of toxin-antitoxin system